MKKKRSEARGAVRPLRNVRKHHRQHPHARSVLEATVADHKRFGRLLHDSLCQELAAISFACEALQQRLEQRSPADAHAVHHVSNALSNMMAHVKTIVRQMDPVSERPHGLVHALAHLAQEVGHKGDAHCTFAGDARIRVHDSTIASNLYRIAEQLVATAIHLCSAGHLRIRLDIDHDMLRLSVNHDGSIEPDFTNHSKRATPEDKILCHRAHGIGATLARRRHRGGKSTMYCQMTNRMDGGEALADFEEEHG